LPVPTLSPLRTPSTAKTHQMGSDIGMSVGMASKDGVRLR